MANTMCKGNPKWGQNAMMENKDLSAKVMEWWLFKKMVVWIFFFVKKKKNYSYFHGLLMEAGVQMCHELQ